MTLRVKLVVPEGEVWAGNADRVIAKTLDGDIGVLTGHTPVLGILATGSVVRILPEEGAAAAGCRPPWRRLPLRGRRQGIDPGQAGRARDRCRHAGHQVALEEAIGVAVAAGEGEASAEVRYHRARLRAAGEDA